ETHGASTCSEEVVHSSDSASSARSSPPAAKTEGPSLLPVLMWLNTILSTTATIAAELIPDPRITDTLSGKLDQKSGAATGITPKPSAVATMTRFRLS